MSIHASAIIPAFILPIRAGVVSPACAGTITNSFLGISTNVSASTPAAIAGITTGHMVTGYFTFSDAPTNYLGDDRYRAATAISLGNLDFMINADGAL